MACVDIRATISESKTIEVTYSLHSKGEYQCTSRSLGSITRVIAGEEANIPCRCSTTVSNIKFENVDLSSNHMMHAHSRTHTQYSYEQCMHAFTLSSMPIEN